MPWISRNVDGASVHKFWTGCWKLDISYHFTALPSHSPIYTKIPATRYSLFFDPHPSRLGGLSIMSNRCSDCRQLNIRQHRSGKLAPLNYLDHSAESISAAFVEVARKASSQLECEDDAEMIIQVANISLTQTTTTTTTTARGQRQRPKEILNSEDPESLPAWFEYFDDLFFLGALGRERRCTPDFVEPEEEYYGTCTDTRGDPDTTAKNVRADIEITFVPHIKCPDKKSSHYLGTLLHEMCHAVFQLYACKSDGPCYDACVENEGCRGHGPAWQDLAAAIQKIAQKHINSDIEIGGLAGFLMELDTLAEKGRFSVEDDTEKAWIASPEKCLHVSKEKLAE